MKLWYENKAEKWTEALPLGNGHMGAMCFGGETGYYALSENTCWSGEEQEYPLSDDAGKYMEEARALLLQNHLKEAHDVMQKHCLSRKGNYGTQLPLGEFWAGIEKKPEKYYRELDLTAGIEKDVLTYTNQTVERISFISNPKKIMAVELKTEQGKMPKCRIKIKGNAENCIEKNVDSTIMILGKAVENMHSDGRTGVEYVLGIRCETDGVTERQINHFITEATFIRVYIAASTSMYDHHMEKTCQHYLDQACVAGFYTVMQEYVKEHSEWMNRCRLSLGGDSNCLATDVQLQRCRENGEDPRLVSLLFEYGKYLIFNSSRKDSFLPAALQGVWNDNKACKMEWTDDMHLDINTQMNYFPTEATGLGECNFPLFKWIKERLMPKGEIVSKRLFQTDGWTANTISNAYGWAAPGWGLEWGISPTCGGWIATHIWNHYLYTEDKDFLKEYYDVLYKCAKGLDGLLQRDPNTNELVVNPSSSPENVYRVLGENYALTPGSLFATAVTKTIFDIVIRASEILQREDAFIQKIESERKELPFYKTGKYGQLMEWNQDFEEGYPDHRHTSHILAMYPFNMVDIDKDGRFKKAVEISLDRRLRKGMGDILDANWAGALLLLYSARLMNSEKAAEYLNYMIGHMIQPNLMTVHQGDAAGIFELDGNTGLTAAILEMLVQKYGNEIKILPAVPSAWKCGEISGVRLQGGSIVDIKWENGTVEIKLVSSKTETLTMTYRGEAKNVIVKANSTYKILF